MRRHLIAVLFVAGWVIPSVQPGHGVAFGASQQLLPYSDYRVEIYLGQCGWLSQGVTLNHIMERTHGRTLPGGPWFGGYLLALGFAVTGVVGNYWPESKLILVPVWMVIRPALVLLAFHTFLFEWLIWRSAFMVVMVIGYYVFALYYKRRFAASVDDTSCRRTIGLSVLFFPLWVLALCVVQSTLPSLGLALSLVGAALLLCDRAEVAPRRAEPEVAADGGGMTAFQGS